MPTDFVPPIDTPEIDNDHDLAAREVIDLFANLPVVTLADSERAARRHRFITAINALPLAVRGTDPGLLFDIIEDWMKPAAPLRDDASAADVALMNRFNDAVETAEKLIRAMLAAIASRAKSRKRYVTNVMRAVRKPTLLYSEGCGEPTAAQPWLKWRDHVAVAAENATEAGKPEEHKQVAVRARTALLLLAGLIPMVAANGGEPSDDDRVRAAVELLRGVRPARRPSGPRGPEPDMNPGQRFVRAICEYRHREVLGVVEKGKTRTAPFVPTAETTALFRAAAPAWGIADRPAQLGDWARQYFNRLLAGASHAQRADADHIDLINLGFKRD